MADHYHKGRRSYVLQPSLLDNHGFQETSRRHGLESNSMFSKIIVSLCLCASVVSSDAVVNAQSGAKNGEWRTYGAEVTFVDSTCEPASAYGYFTPFRDEASSDTTHGLTNLLKT